MVFAISSWEVLCCKAQTRPPLVIIKRHKTRSMTMALPIWGVLGGMTALFFSALFLRGQKMLEPRRALLKRDGTK